MSSGSAWRWLLPACCLVPSWAMAALEYSPDLAASPPAVQQATVELMTRPTATANALVRVQFADKRSKTTLVINGGNGPVPLRDDGVAPDERAGDGVYTAGVLLDAEQLAVERTRRSKLAAKNGPMPVFQQRKLVGRIEYVPPKSVQLVAGVPDIIDRFLGFPVAVDAERSLLVRDPSVVEDPARTWEPCTGAGTPMGAWTFGRLVTEIANQPATGIDPADLVQHWLDDFKYDQVINGFNISRRLNTQQFIDSWPKLPNGKLDVARAPFRLLAIVNRQDLRGSTLYGATGAGEGRLVFGAVACTPLGGNGQSGALQFTVIFEYGVPRSGCVSVRDWARQWVNLGTLVLGSAPYNAALQALTDQFTLRGVNPAQLPNGSALKQWRSDEFALGNADPSDTLWQLREARLVGSGPWAGYVEHDTTAQTPDLIQFMFLQPDRLRDWINANSALILAGKHTVPLNDGAGSFLSGTGESGRISPWNAPGILNLEARHGFALATCDGCHNHETGTRFTHIKPRQIGVASQLSGFLTGAGMPVNDPVSGVARTFHDLQDRAAKLDLTANMSCVKKSLAFPIDELFLVTVPPAFKH